jgi:sterol desaturase/sphingolipid hydroxylase (fatty acid hydroxylase superfamily)
VFAGLNWSGWSHWATSYFWTISLITLVLVGVAEVFFEAQPPRLPAWRRWSAHVFLFILIQLALNPFRAISGHALAEWVQSKQIGLFHSAALPLGLRYFLTILLLDFVHYFTHYLYHHSSWLWRFHAIHHNDEDMDWSTGYRFHPVEAFLNLLIDSTAILLIGPPAEVILLFVLLLSVQNFLCHANFTIPAPITRVLDRFWISPNLHRLHHSDRLPHQQSNYGTLFSLWDHVFRTINLATPATLGEIRVGLSEAHSHPVNNPLRLIAAPFLTRNHRAPRRDPPPYPQPDSRTS